ncbi:unnamed protein product [Rhodiola kirilowii]
MSSNPTSTIFPPRPANSRSRNRNTCLTGQDSISHLSLKSASSSFSPSSSSSSSIRLPQLPSTPIQPGDLYALPIGAAFLGRNKSAPPPRSGGLTASPSSSPALLDLSAATCH